MAKKKTITEKIEESEVEETIVESTEESSEKKAFRALIEAYKDNPKYESKKEALLAQLNELN